MNKKPEKGTSFRHLRHRRVRDCLGFVTMTGFVIVLFLLTHAWSLENNTVDWACAVDMPRTPVSVCATAANLLLTWRQNQRQPISVCVMLCQASGICISSHAGLRQ